MGKYVKELRSFILVHTPRVITSIKVSFVHSISKSTITISSDNIFKQMTEYIVLLPDDASEWLLSLAETYFRALTPAMQADMNQHKFKMPAGIRSSFKVVQISNY